MGSIKQEDDIILPKLGETVIIGHEDGNVESNAKQNTQSDWTLQEERQAKRR